MRRLEKQEKQLLAKIEEAGLVRVIHHYDKMYDGRKTTYASFYEASEYASSKEKEKLKAIADAYACVGNNDRFNKRLGRVIATGRAWKKYQRMCNATEDE